MSGTISNKTYFTQADLRNIRQAVDGSGADLFKAAATAAPPSDGMQDVLIMAPSNEGMFAAADAKDMAKSLKSQGVNVQDNLPGVGVAGKVSAETADELKDKGYQVFDNSPRNLLPGMPRVMLSSSDGTPWAMPKVDPIKDMNVQPLHNAGINGQGVVVAVIDSGFDNPAKQGQLTGYHDMTSPGASFHDGAGHGTHVADDVWKTAPQARISAIRVMNDQGQGRPSDIIRGIQEAIREKRSGEADISVINMSLGGEASGTPSALDPIDRAVEQATKAGITVVAAAGNSGPNEHTIGSPADAKSALAVGSGLNPSTVSTFSSRGPTDDGINKPSVVADGEFIVGHSPAYSEMYQTAQVVEKLRGMSGDQLKQLIQAKPQLKEGLGLPDDILNHSGPEVEQLVKPKLPPVYLTDDNQVAAPGTSFASPLTAGVVADLHQANKNATPAQLEDALQNTANNMGSQWGVLDQGHGFVNAGAAWKAVTA